MVWENQFNSIKNRYDSLSPEKKRRLVLAGAISFCAFLTLAVFVSIFSGKREDKKIEHSGQDEIDFLAAKIQIPLEELFIPDEPDFVPDVMLDRERREAWTDDDMMEFWRDPLREGEEQWRDKIDAAINEILERVP